jgi:hypothetical protein
MEISAWKEGGRLDEGSLSSSTYRFDRNEIKKNQQATLLSQEEEVQVSIEQIGMCDSSSDDHVPLGDLHKCHTMRADSLAQSSSKKKPRDVSSGNRLSSTSASSPKKLPSTSALEPAESLPKKLLCPSALVLPAESLSNNADLLADSCVNETKTELPNDRVRKEKGKKKFDKLERRYHREKLKAEFHQLYEQAIQSPCIQALLQLENTEEFEGELPTYYCPT